VVLYVRPGRAIRVAFVCGRRVGGAVVRNRARRLMKEAWRGLAPGVQGGFDIVLMARPEIAGARLADVMVDVRAALQAARLIEP
jgi:ribonuclease P protein component